MNAPSSTDTTTAAVADVRPLRQLCGLTLWVAGGRALTQTGRIRLTDARELVALLETGDDLDPLGGSFKITSSADLPQLSLIVEWAKACGLVRVARGRLVAVKKNARLLDRPDELWDRMFDVFGQLGKALCLDGWGQSLLRDEFQDPFHAVIAAAHLGGGTIALSDACELAWEMTAARYVLGGLSEQQLDVLRRCGDRDLGRALAVLERLGAVRLQGDTITLSERGLGAIRRALGEAAAGDAVVQLKITLIGVSKPPVWRRVVVPADIRLDRLHRLIQAAMGWSDGHMHLFSAGGVDYGLADPELGSLDERRMSLDGLLAKSGDRMRYTYDFGDDWEHEIVVEQLLRAEPGIRYPICVDGRSRCPPEDCGGVWGYALLRETLADPSDVEHAEMLDWLGLDSAAEFDPAQFDVGEVNVVL